MTERLLPGEQRAIPAGIDGVDFLKLVTGNLNPMLGVLRGKLRISGDLAIASALNSVMKPPTARGQPGHARATVF